MDPKLTKEAERRLDNLLAANPGADLAGVIVRIDHYIVTVTREGRVQWFEQDGLGGIKYTDTTDTRTPNETMDEINTRHGRNSEGKFP